MYTIGIVCSRGVGPERGGRKRNEDNYLICHDSVVTYLDRGVEKREMGGGEGSLVAVCDGMGGHVDGDVASSAAVRVLAKLYRPGLPNNPSRALRKYILEAHKRLHWKARDRGPVSMGTTITACWLLKEQVAWAQVGDSRLYLFRDDQLTQLTFDHTRNEFARRDGRTETPDGGHLAQNFIYGSRGLGDNTTLRLEMDKDVGSFDLLEGDRLLLCTDGLWGSVDDASLAEVIRHTDVPQAVAVACLERAIARGSTDNITVMVVNVDSLDSETDETWEDITAGDKPPV
ncbi:MAG: serine/threonine-protein phosphatase [Proteobacteria bacterium]|jgi:PPM family protein phosphatase|nr:serine/threonine-protein phosphatase [Pseudomonadota bacterium]